MGILPGGCLAWYHAYMTHEPNGMPELRAAVRDRPEAVVAWTVDDRAVLVLERLDGAGLQSVPRSQALRRSGAEKVGTGVWLVPRELLERADVPAPEPEDPRTAFMRSAGLL